MMEDGMGEESSAAAGSTPLLCPERELSPRLADASGLLLCTDFDGTLTPIVDDHEAAEITATNRESLRRLHGAPQVRVAVVSGRAVEDLRRRVGVEGLTYAGNHGLELHRDGRTAVHPIARKRRSSIERISEAGANRVDDVDGCVVEDKGVTASVHYRNAPEDRHDEIRATVRRAVDRHAPDRVETATGKAVLELRPALPWDKGSVVRLLGDDAGRSWFTVYIGDDTTDEDAFRAIARDGLGVYVGGDDQTAASRRLPDTEAVERVLSWLADDGVEALSDGEGC